MKNTAGARDTAHKRPNLKTIAEISGLAVTTVSRALGDAPDISRETKARVRKIANDVGYVPNRAGVRLRTGRTNVISLVLETEHDVMNMTSRLISSIANGLSGTGFHLVMTPEIPDQDPLSAVRYVVETRSADAIIINKIQPQDPRVAYLREQNFPFVTHGRTVWANEHAYYDYDNKAFGRIAIETLAKKGRKNILLLAPPVDQNYAQEMISGAVNGAQSCGVSLIVAENVSSDSARIVIEAGIADNLSKFPKTDALISASPNATMIAIAALEAEGRSIGREFDVFSKETVPFLKLFRPGILTLQEDVEKAGLFLAKAALQEVVRKDGRPMQKMDAPSDSEQGFQKH